jgi:serine/threonine-protein kinase ATR
MQHGGANGLRQSIDMRGVAKNALAPIERKLKGIHASNLASINKESGANPNKELGTAHLVQVLIQEATDTHNLVRALRL